MDDLEMRQPLPEVGRPDNECEPPDARTCWRCDTDRHACPGCGVGVPHGVVACPECSGSTLHDRLREMYPDLDYDPVAELRACSEELAKLRASVPVSGRVTGRGRARRFVRVWLGMAAGFVTGAVVVTGMVAISRWSVPAFLVSVVAIYVTACAASIAFYSKDEFDA